MTAQAVNKILALDVGGRRIGLAVASTIARLPRPLKTILNDEKVWEELASVIKEEQIDAVVVGRPLNMSGQETEQTRTIRKFTQEFTEHFKLPVTEQDETLTSKQAEQELRARGVQFEKGDIDALAAVYILEDYLKTMEVR